MRITESQLRRIVESLLVETKIDDEVDRYAGRDDDWRRAKKDIEQWSKGKGNEDLRNRYWSGWTNDDFSKLLQKMSKLGYK